MINTRIVQFIQQLKIFYANCSKILERIYNIFVRILILEIKKIRKFDWQTIRKLINAIKNNFIVKIKYDSFNSNKITTRKIHPYHVYSYEGEFYLVAFCENRKKFRDFFIGRIQNLEILDQKFKDDSFDIKKYFNDKYWNIIKGGKITKVKFKVTKQKAKWVKEKFSNKIKKYKEDKLWEFYKCETAINQGFIKWIISYGKNIIILYPKKVREKVKKYCNEILENYAQ
ncbi:WYL domain-containing protein [Candidatus Dojkabacteria bacterium]|nr:WYL domain-containing protein [Candidatus Dojkabacteria bacterium]